MSVEFQLGHGDHLKVEDFLARRATGVGAITLSPKNADKQTGAAEAARDAGLEVLFDPATEKLADTGFGLETLPCWAGAPYDVERLVIDPDGRQGLVDRVVEVHPAKATIVTPPHFLVRDERSANLNIALAETTRLATDKPVRPIVILRNAVPDSVVENLAGEYVRAGFTQIDVRLSPLGGDNDSVRKIRRAFARLSVFTDAGLQVTFGRAGNAGQTAFALGLVNGYSVGIGQWETVDHAQAINRQQRPPKHDDEGHRKGGVWQGVYLPGPAVTVSMRTATALLSHTDIRTRVGCRIDSCASSITGPLVDHRTHYLRARANEMADLQSRPAAWRATAELERLHRAIDLRQLINRNHRGSLDSELKTRTLHSLIDDIDEAQAAASA